MARFLIAPVILFIVWILTSIFLVVLSFHIFSRLTDEKPIASVHFQKLKPQVYKAYLSKGADDYPVEYQIFGDQWRIDARFIKLAAWANIFGLDAQYNLERFEGRYKSIRDENSQPHLAHDLGENNLMVLPQFLLDYNFLIDAEYGSSTYQNIDLLKRYTVYRTQSGILIRHQPLSTAIDDEPGLIDKVIDVFKY